jgi:hypothetical protein
MVIEHGRMEKRVLDSCKAIINLKMAYNGERLENACIRGLFGPKYNYEVLKNILLNNLDQIAPGGDFSKIEQSNLKQTQWQNSGIDNESSNTDHLRGAASFNPIK